MTMTRLKTTLLVLAAAVVLPTLATGCLVQPWTYDRMSNRYEHDKDHKTPILPPIRAGFAPPRCEDAPSDNEVMRLFNERRIRGVPYVYEEFQDDIQIVKNLRQDTIDPPRFFPLVGMAQLHHCHWECGIYYNDLVQSSYPYPAYIKKQKVEVLLIDKDHLHLYVGENPDQQRDTLIEMTKWR